MGEGWSEREQRRERKKITRQTDLCFFPIFNFVVSFALFLGIIVVISRVQLTKPSLCAANGLRAADRLSTLSVSHTCWSWSEPHFSFHSMSITCRCQLPLVAHGDFTSKSFVFGRKELGFSHRTTSWILHVYSRPGQLSAELTKTRAWAFMSPALSALCQTVFIYFLFVCFGAESCAYWHHNIGFRHYVVLSFCFLLLFCPYLKTTRWLSDAGLS